MGCLPTQVNKTTVFIFLAGVAVGAIAGIAYCKNNPLTAL